MKIRHRNLLLLLAIASVVSLQSCEAPSPTQVQAILSESQTLLDNLRTSAQQMSDVIAQEQDASRRAESQAALDRLNSQITDIQAWRNTVADAFDDTGELRPEGVLPAIATALPPPWNVITAVVLTGVLSYWKTRGGRVAFQRLVAGINAAKASNPQFASALHEVGPTIRLSLGKSAPIVDEVRRNGATPTAPA